MIDIRNTEVGKFFEGIVTTDITRTEMKRILENKNFPDTISFVSIVPEDMNQYLDYWITDENGKKHKNPNPTRNPYYDMGIKKLVRKFKIVTGFDYENSINNRLKKEEKEPDFEAKRPVWYDMISKSLVTDRKTHTKFYLRYQYQNDSTIGKPEFFFNNDPIEKALFESYLTKKDYDNQYSNQGLDDTLNFQVCDLENILYVSMDNQHYRLVD